MHPTAQYLLRPLARPTRRVPRHRPRGPNRVASLSNVAPHVVVASLRVGVRGRFVLWSAEAFEVGGFGGSGGERQPSSAGEKGDWGWGRWRERMSYRPVEGFTSPPSDKGISRLLPAPDAAEP